MIEQLLFGKISKEKSLIKSTEISKLKHSGVFDDVKNGIKIEIIGDVLPVTVNGQSGIQVFARAWKGGKQLGFGADGSIEIERFRIFNPPILVEDINGTILRDQIDTITKKIIQKKFREDPVEAVRQSISHSISIVGKEDTQITLGKIGNTTSVFYADVLGDGTIQAFSATYSTVRSAATGTADQTTPSVCQCSVSGAVYYINRDFFPFDTSAIPDGDTISSATFSLYGSAGTANADTTNIGLIQTTQASGTALATTDYDNLTLNTPTEGATRVALSGWATAAYNDFAMNASGISWISKTTFTFLGTRLGHEIDNTTPTGLNQAYFQTADAVGTTNDPKLVVIHTTPTARPGGTLALMGCGM